MSDDEMHNVDRRRAIGPWLAAAVVVVSLIVAACGLRSGGGGAAGSPDDEKALAQLEEYCGSTTYPLGTYANGEQVRGMCYYCFEQTTDVSGTGPGCKPGETVPPPPGPPPTDPPLICGGVPAGPPRTPPYRDYYVLVMVNPSSDEWTQSHVFRCIDYGLGFRQTEVQLLPPDNAVRVPKSGVMVPPGGDSGFAQRVMDLLGLGSLPYDPNLVGDQIAPTDRTLPVVVLGDDAAQQMGIGPAPPPTAVDLGPRPWPATVVETTAPNAPPWSPSLVP